MSVFGAIEPPDREYEVALTKQLTAANASGGRYELEIALQSATELVSHHLLVDFEVAFLRSLSVARGKLKQLIMQNVVAGEPPECVLAHAQASAEAKARADERRAAREAKREMAPIIQEGKNAEQEKEGKMKSLARLAGEETQGVEGGAPPPPSLSSITSSTAAGDKVGWAHGRESDTHSKTATMTGNEREDVDEEDQEEDETLDEISELPSLSVQSLSVQKLDGNSSVESRHQRTETAPGLMGQTTNKAAKKKRNSLWSSMGNGTGTPVTTTARRKHAKRGSLMPNFFRKKSSSIASPRSGLKTTPPLAPAAPPPSSHTQQVPALSSKIIDASSNPRRKSSMTDKDLEALLSRSTSLAPDAAVDALMKAENTPAANQGRHKKTNSYEAIVGAMDYDHTVLAVELFGAGSGLVNGLYTRVGMRTQAPVFESSSGFRITREIAQDGTLGWICGKLESDGYSRAFYGAADSSNDVPQKNGPPKNKFVALEGNDPPPRVENYFGKMNHDEDGTIVVHPWSVPFDRERFLNQMEMNGGVVVIKHPRDYLGKPTNRVLWIDMKDGGRLNFAKESAAGGRAYFRRSGGVESSESERDSRSSFSKSTRGVKGLEFKRFISISKGKTTDVFKRTSDDVDESMCLSVIASSRTLDLRCASKKMRDWLYRGLTLVALKNRAQRGRSVAVK